MRKLIFIFVLIFSFSLMSFSVTESAVAPFWGSETTCTTTYGSGGDCCTTTTCIKNYYVFWIRVSSELVSFDNDCSGCNPQINV